MPWPPKIGEPLPRAAVAVGVREKLVGYSPDMANEVGAPKARGFALILGITLDDVDHLEVEIRAGILVTPVSGIRSNSPYGVNCVVAVPVRGVGEKNERVVSVRTIWEITHWGAPPRLVSALPQALDWRSDGYR
jgi:hypothetical protein